MDDEIGGEWKWSNLPSDLVADIERWFHARPDHDDLLPPFEAEGATLAARVQAAAGIPVRYLSSTSRFRP